MDRGRKFEVLEGLKLILKLIEIYPANWSVRNVRIPIPLIFRPFFASLILFVITTTWLCIHFEWDLSLISGPLCFLFGTFQILLMHFFIMLSKSIIVESTDLLQQLVQQREIF